MLFFVDANKTRKKVVHTVTAHIKICSGELIVYTNINFHPSFNI
jgi:hypothetical protein